MGENKKLVFTFRPLGYERVYLPLYEVADTHFHIQGHKLTLNPGVDTRVNPCAAKVVNLRLQANFRLSKKLPKCVT